jgi:acetylornithine deacetylase/succinyl-diaminopimelate desuccinylase-like protein
MIDTHIVNRTLDLAVEIQQIPAPTFAEAERSKFILESFRKHGLKDITQDDLGNVFARYPGKDQASPLIVTAHMDTVFPADTDLSVHRTASRIRGPGIGDNSIGIAGLSGLFWALQDAGTQLPADVWLVANVGEEALGNLIGMQAVVERFGDQPVAYLVIEGMAYGRVYHRGLGVRRYGIEVQTKGGHSWVNYGHPSAIHELAALVSVFTGILLPKKPRTTLNVGKICGGVSVNTIAQEASLELDLRSIDPESLCELVSQVEDLVRAANHEGVRVTMESLGERPVGELPQDHSLVQLAAEVLKEQGIQPDLNVGSTDANIPLSLGFAAICVGLTTGGGAHTLEEYINTRQLKQGLEQLVALVERIIVGLGA